VCHCETTTALTIVSPHKLILSRFKTTNNLSALGARRFFVGFASASLASCDRLCTIGEIDQPNLTVLYQYYFYFADLVLAEDSVIFKEAVRVLRAPAKKPDHDVRTTATKIINNEAHIPFASFADIVAVPAIVALAGVLTPPVFDIVVPPPTFDTCAAIVGVCHRHDATTDRCAWIEPWSDRCRRRHRRTRVHARHHIAYARTCQVSETRHRANLRRVHSI
jgi:hypothetical protein